MCLENRVVCKLEKATAWKVVLIDKDGKYTAPHQGDHYDQVTTAKNHFGICAFVTKIGAQAAANCWFSSKVVKVILRNITHKGKFYTSAWDTRRYSCFEAREMEFIDPIPNGG